MNDSLTGRKPHPTEPKPDVRAVPTSEPIVYSSIAKPAYSDREIHHAAVLSAAIRDMRRDLGRDGVKRVMLFVMERWGTHTIVGLGLLVDDQIPNYETTTEASAE